MGVNKVNGLGILLVFCLLGLGFVFFNWLCFYRINCGKNLLYHIVCKLIALFVIKDWQHVLAQ